MHVESGLREHEGALSESELQQKSHVWYTLRCVLNFEIEPEKEDLQGYLKAWIKQVSC